MSRRRAPALRPDAVDRTGWRWNPDLRVGVLQDLTDSDELRTVQVGVIVALMIDEGRWQKPGREPTWQTVDPERIARRAGIAPITAGRLLAELADAGRWLSRDDAGAFTYGPELRASVTGCAETGGLAMFSPHHLAAIVDHAAELANGDRGGERWAWPDLLVMVGRCAAAGGSATYDGTQRRLADLTGIDPGDVCRTLQRLERLGVLRQGRRHMATQPGDPEPRAERLGNCLAGRSLEWCRTPEAAEAGRQWIARHARPAPQPTPPQLPQPVGDGRQRRQRRMSASRYWQALAARNVAIAQRRRRQAAMKASSPPAAMSAPQRPPTPPLRT